MTQRIALGLVLMLAVGPLGATAQEADTTRLVLSETATREVEQDTLVATLAVRAEAESPRAAQAEVNAAMAAAIDKAEAVETLERSTGIYRVRQRRDREGEPSGWVAEQELRLETGDAAPLLSLVGELQEDGLLLQGLAYELSRAARRALRDDLTLAAIETLTARAARIAEALDMTVERFATVRVGDVGDVPPIRPMFQARAAEAQATPPAALPERTTVDVTVDAEVDLAPR